MIRGKKRGEAETPENHEGWLLTYSDMIVLLLTLFMILYSMSTINTKKFADMAEQTGYQMDAVSSSAAANGGTGNGGGTGTGNGETTTNAGSLNSMMNALDETYVILQSYMEKNHLEDQIDLVSTNTHVKVHLRGKMMFMSDSSRMLPESKPILKEVTEAISKVYDRVDHITFSGHTASVGPHVLSDDQTSWRLSTERTVTVLTKVIGYGMKQSKVSIKSYTHFSSVANNNNEKGRTKNRRVEITVLRSPPIIPTDTSKPSPDSAASSAAASGQSESSKATH